MEREKASKRFKAAAHLTKVCIHMNENTTVRNQPSNNNSIEDDVPQTPAQNDNNTDDLSLIM